MHVFGNSGNRSTNIVLVLLAALVAFIPAQAETINFVATDLADINPGEDLWQYAYTVSGHTFHQSNFFDIFFDPSLYGAPLSAGAAPNGDWGVSILQQPDPTKFHPFDEGIFDAFALTDNPSLSGTFLVSFVFLGPGKPGAQPFQIFDSNLPPNLVASGFTSAPGTPIPEPSTAVLLLTGLVSCAIYIRRRSAIRR